MTVWEKRGQHCERMIPLWLIASFLVSDENWILGLVLGLVSVGYAVLFLIALACEWVERKEANSGPVMEENKP